jgi:hypothetical protein
MGAVGCFFTKPCCWEKSPNPTKVFFFPTMLSQILCKVAFPRQYERKDKPLILEQQNRSKNLKELFKKSYWLKNVEVNDETYPYQCIGGCGRTSKSIKLTYFDEKRNLCFDCFIDKNDELAKKYKVQKPAIWKVRNNYSLSI